MSEQRSRTKDYLVYLAVRVAVCVFQALPYGMARRCSAGLAWLAYRLDKRHRQVADDNLRHAYGDQFSPPARDALVRAVFRHFCGLIMEIVQIPRRLTPTSWRRHVELVNGPLVVRHMLSGRPVMLVTAHFGNWEVGGYVLSLLGFKSHAIARPLDNPYLDDFLRSFRERTGQGLIAKKGDFDRLEALLRDGAVVATLGDQDAGARGLFVEFFGRPASCHKAVALLAIEHQAPMVVLGVRKSGEPMRYQVVVEEALDPADYEGQPGAVKAMTERFTRALERVIRTAPEQYFWLHRRWKHQPAARKTKQAA